MPKIRNWSNGEVVTAAKLNAITPLAVTEGQELDSGWIDCPVAMSGGNPVATGVTLQARVIGNIMYVEGLAYATYGSGSNVVVANLPASLPLPSRRKRGGAFAEGGRGAGYRIEASGSIAFAWHSMGTTGAAPTWIQITAAFPLD